MSRVDKLADELEAASKERVAGWRAERLKAEGETPQQRTATAETLREALVGGGRAVLTVRSGRTGTHVTIRLVAKKRENGRGWVSRATIDGRVGLPDADALFADDPDLEWPDSRVGFLNLRTGEWKIDDGADPARAWAAAKAIQWIHGGYPLDDQAECFLETTCSSCGKRLTDPESIERGIGPECAGRRTKSRAAEREAA